MYSLQHYFVSAGTLVVVVDLRAQFENVLMVPVEKLSKDKFVDMPLYHSGTLI